MLAPDNSDLPNAARAAARGEAAVPDRGTTNGVPAPEWATDRVAERARRRREEGDRHGGRLARCQHHRPPASSKRSANICASGPEIASTTVSATRTCRRW